MAENVFAENEMQKNDSAKNDRIVRKKEFSDRLAEKCGMAKLDAFWFVNVFWYTLIEFLADGCTVQFYGIGKFEMGEMKEMWAGNLNLGKNYYVPGRRKVKFRTSDALQRKIEDIYAKNIGEGR